MNQNKFMAATRRDDDDVSNDSRRVDRAHLPGQQRQVGAGIAQSPGNDALKQWTTLAVDVVRGFMRGMSDSVDVTMLASYLRGSQALRRLFFQCTVVNMVLFVSVWGASVFVSPLFAVIVGRHSAPSSASGADATPSQDSLGTSAGGVWGALGSIRSPANVLSAVRNSPWISHPPRGNPGLGERLVTGLWNSLFDVLWVIPMFALTQCFGIKWYAELFSEAAKEKKRIAAANSAPLRGGTASDQRDRAESKDISEIVTSISEMIFKLIATILFTFVNVLIGVAFPIGSVGFTISLLMNCWLHSFYCFDYRLASQFYISKEVVQVPPERAAQNAPTHPHSARRSVKRRLGLTGELSLFETNWPYYLGFGMIATTLPMWLRTYAHLPWFAVASLSSVIFGMNVVMTVWATPGPSLRSTYRLPVFTPFFAALGWIMKTSMEQLEASSSASHPHSE